MVNCIAKAGTSCQHTPAECGNCGAAHPATAANCPKKRDARRHLSKPRDQTWENTQEPSATIPSTPGSIVVARNRLRSHSEPGSPRGIGTQPIAHPIATLRTDQAPNTPQATSALPAPRTPQAYRTWQSPKTPQDAEMYGAAQTPRLNRARSLLTPQC
jgi:hypothetical protein